MYDLIHEFIHAINGRPKSYQLAGLIVTLNLPTCKSALQIGTNTIEIGVLGARECPRRTEAQDVGPVDAVEASVSQ